MSKPFAEEMKYRTMELAKEIIHFSKEVGQEYPGKILINQLLRCATSTAANYRAVCRARSGKEFFSKLSITIEEADETVFWLELFEQSGLVAKDGELKELQQKAVEILSILATARKTYRQNQKRNP